MKFTLQTLQNALLVFTVVMLVYVLYKRLLIALGKRERQKKYPSVGEKVVWKDRKATLEMTFYESSELDVSIFSPNGDKVTDVMRSAYEPGLQQIEVDCTKLTPGKYYFKLTSPSQESSIYFDIH